MFKNIKDKFSIIIPSIIGGSVFLFFTFFLNVNLFFSIGLGLAGFIASIFLFQGKSKKEIEFSSFGITKSQYEEILKEGESNLNILYSYQKNIKNKIIAGKIQEIIDVIEKIFDDLRKDPKDIKAAKQFLNYYLITTINIIKKYIDLSSHNVKSNKVDNTLKRVETLLDTIKTAFEKQLEKLLSDDILDLDSEIKVLEQTIKLEVME